MALITGWEEPPVRSDGKYFGWSSMGGYFVSHNGKTYWHDGTVNDGPLTMMPSTHTEDYSAWTDEHRAEVAALNQARYAQARADEQAHNSKMSAIAERAEAKLTVEEKEALAWKYRD